MEKKQVENLAKLARLHIEESELETLGNDLEHILSYVGSVSTISGNGKRNEQPLLYNNFADDVAQTKTGEYTEMITDAFPEKQEGFLKVKSILNS